MHVHRLLTTTPWPTVRFKDQRLWDTGTTWSFLEPRKGEWHFGPLDRLVLLAADHGVNVTLTFGRTPPWASSASGPGIDPKKSETAPPASLDDWRDFVRKVATRYKGKIHAYEMWNEPNLAQFYTGDVRTLVSMTREASQIIHSVDPSALVVSPSPTADSGLSWLREFLAEGGGQYVDIIGYHLYVIPDPPEKIAALAEGVKSVLAEEHVNRPLWNTETGWSKPKVFASDYEASSYIARALLLAWTSGFDRFYWYAWDNREWCTLTLTKDDTHGNANAVAYDTVENWMIGKRVESCSREKDHTWVCNLKNADSASFIFWNPDRKVPFHPPQTPNGNVSWRLSDLTGQTKDVNAGQLMADEQPRMIQLATRKSD